MSSSTLELIAGVVGAASVAVSLAMLAAIPWLVRRLPADHFVRTRPKKSRLAHALRNAIGLVLVTAGVALLVLPGQGVLTVLLGLSVLDLPWNRRAIVWLLRRRHVQSTVQRIRKKAGKPPLAIPDRTQTA